MNSFDRIKKLLPLVQKPARYIGGEEGSIVKAHSGKLAFALAFPEEYEIGASHFGGQIIYHIVNRENDLVCERVYMPANDFRKILRSKNIPLFSLETKTPLKNFDVVGFTLETELSYTNVLEMLYLGGIPIFPLERENGNSPLVIAGGTGAFSPEPMSDFFDAFFIGDAEAGFVDVLRTIKSFLDAGKNRIQILREISKIAGVYVPSLYTAEFDGGKFVGLSPVDDAPYPIHAAIASKLENSFYPSPPILPWIEVVHNRLRAEMNRGCGRGCRFCQASFLYRPLRERTPDDIFSELRKNFALTGWEEMGILSLSATDYTAISAFLDKVDSIVKREQVKFSLPSLRIDQLGDRAFDVLGENRKMGLTFAPEAGTERLRSVINKPLDEGNFYETIEKALIRKWRSIKLYFMLGLPTETDADVEGIIDMLRKINGIAKRYGATVRVTLSPFVPKPHTPFQWEQFFSIDELARREEMIINGAPKRIKISARDPKISAIEALISRGDRRFGKAIYNAWQNGAIYAAWGEFFNPDLFFDAIEKNGLNRDEFLSEKDVNSALPWDIVDKGIRKEFLLREREKGYTGKFTPPCWERDCEKCAFCDVPPQVLAEKSFSEKIITDAPPKKDIRYGRRIKRESRSRIGTAVPLVRIKYSRFGDVRFIGHLDTLRLWERMLRKAKVPLDFTEGYHTRAKISFSPPLPLGCESADEYIDVYLNAEIGNEHIKSLAKAMPAGFNILAYKPISSKPQAMQNLVKSALWRCVIHTDAKYIENAMRKISEQTSIQFQRHKKIVDIRPLLLKWSVRSVDDGAEIKMLLRAGDSGSGRPTEFFRAAGLDENTVADGRYIRENLLIPSGNGWLSLMGEYVKLPF